MVIKASRQLWCVTLVRAGVYSAGVMNLVCAQEIVADAAPASSLHAELLTSGFHAHDVDALECWTATHRSGTGMFAAANCAEIDARNDGVLCVGRGQVEGESSGEGQCEGEAKVNS